MEARRSTFYGWAWPALPIIYALRFVRDQLGWEMLFASGLQNWRRVMQAYQALCQGAGGAEQHEHRNETFTVAMTRRFGRILPCLHPLDFSGISHLWEQ